MCAALSFAIVMSFPFSSHDFGLIKCVFRFPFQSKSLLGASRRNHCHLLQVRDNIHCFRQNLTTNSFWCGSVGVLLWMRIPVMLLQFLINLQPPVAPLPCPGPPVKKRRREDQLRGGEEVATVKTEGEGSGGEAQQMVRFVTFQPGKWSQTFSQSRTKLPTPVLKVLRRWQALDHWFGRPGRGRGRRQSRSRSGRWSLE